MHLYYQVKPEDHGRRAVDVLIRQTGMSRLMSKKVRLYGHLTCNGMAHRMIDPVRAGDILVAIYQPHVEQGGVLNEVPGVSVRYLDDWLLVVSKPAGMVTHPTYLHETGSLTSSLADYPLHPVSRLDRDTSGLVLIARNGHAHHVISQNPMHKIYLGLIHGRLPEKIGLIDAPIQRSTGSIMLREVHADGAEAKTRWRELHYFAGSNVSMVSFELLTGRTHQIRVHCRHMNCPLIGDGLYGWTADPNLADQAGSYLDRFIGRQALHAASLDFYHPISGLTIHLTAPLPDDFRQLLRLLYQCEHDRL
ncbi:MAG TPA: hypothetical protein DCM45_06385 [Clostridiales bacterium]|nr:hypothetical protein [Clostridiales bacterium]